MIDWDRSGRWVVHRHHEARLELAVEFAGAQPSVRELAAIRAVFPRFADVPAAEMKSMLAPGARQNLGVFSDMEARELIGRAEARGLRLSVRNASSISYSPIDRRHDGALIVEDEAEARRVAEEMIAAGFPVKDSVREIACV